MCLGEKRRRCAWSDYGRTQCKSPLWMTSNEMLDAITAVVMDLTAR